MFIDVLQRPDRVTFLLDPADDDAAELKGGVRLVRDRVDFRLPRRVDQIHPDLLALTAYLVAGPYTRRSLDLGWPVSQRFAEALASATRLVTASANEAVAPREVPDGVPGLCYSGGVDCTAALTVMPSSTELFFLERVAPWGQPWQGAYDKSAALAACAGATAAGRQVHVVQTDLEYVRSPVGFPDHLSNAGPLVLLADESRLDAVAWGTIMESAYRIGAAGFADYAERPVYAGANELFASVGLPLFNPVAGLSEVATSAIALRSPYGEFSQSCMRGTVGEPCRSCWKCFRKSLLDSSLTGQWPDHAELDRMFDLKSVRPFIDAVPMKHENVLTYATHRYPGDHELMQALRRRVRGDSLDVDWLTRHYPPALDLVPDRYRAATCEALEQHVAPMSDADVAAFRAWEVGSLASDPAVVTAAADFVGKLDRHTQARQAAREAEKTARAEAAEAAKAAKAASARARRPEPVAPAAKRKRRSLVSRVRRRLRLRPSLRRQP